MRKSSIKFNNEDEEEEQNDICKLLVEQKKLLRTFTSEIEIIKEICKEDFQYIVKPDKQIKPNKTKDEIKDVTVHKQIQYLSKKISYSQLFKDMTSQILKEERSQIFDSKNYGNCMAIMRTQNEEPFIVYVSKSLDNQTYIRTASIQNTSSVNITLDNKDSQIQDKTGTYEIQIDDEFIYLRHIYGISKVSRSLLQDDVTLRNPSQIINESQLLKILINNQKLYSLDCSGYIKSFDSNFTAKTIHKIDSKLASSFRAFSIEKGHDNNQLYCLSRARIHLYDLRQKQMNLVTSVSIDKIMENRYFAIKTLDGSDYYVVNTNLNIQIYDQRQSSIPVIIQRNCSDEAPPSILISEDQQKEQYLMLGYSPQKNGGAMMIQFDPMILEGCSSVQLQVSKKVDGQDRHTSFFSEIMGFPLMLFTSPNLDSDLKLRGMQILKLNDSYFILSLDNRGGLGLQVFDDELQPNSFDSSSISLSSPNKRRKRSNSYNSIFDDEEEEQLRPIFELQKQRQEISVSKLISKLENTELEQNEMLRSTRQRARSVHISTQELDFEDLLIKNVDQQINIKTSNLEILQFNKDFILTPQIIDFLKKDYYQNCDFNNNI